MLFLLFFIRAVFYNCAAAFAGLHNRFVGCASASTSCASGSPTSTCTNRWASRATIQISLVNLA